MKDQNPKRLFNFSINQILVKTTVLIVVTTLEMFTRNTNMEHDILNTLRKVLPSVKKASI